MRRVLIAFTSHEGQTRTIAHHVARQIEDRGPVCRLIDLSEDRFEAGADDCDAAIVAGSIHRGAYDPLLAGFIMRHAASLHQVPSAFLSVSLAAASDDQDERAALDEIARRFLAEVGWMPDHIEHVAGALHDREMNFVEREILHAIVDSKGVQRHPSGHTELTDWPKLDAFIARFVAQVRGGAK